MIRHWRQSVHPLASAVILFLFFSVLHVVLLEGNIEVIDLLKKMENDPQKKEEQNKSDKFKRETKFEDLFSDDFDGTCNLIQMIKNQHDF